jgi:hypothetical protein
VRDAELGASARRSLHGGPVGVAAHDNSNHGLAGGLDAHTVIDIAVDSLGDKCDGLMADIIRTGRPDFKYEMDCT